jgi:hypothetical protein
VFALSAAVDTEIADLLDHPKFAERYRSRGGARPELGIVLR